MPVGKKTAEELTQWRTRLTVADQLTQQHLHTSWDRTLKNYRGEYFTGAALRDISLPVNVVQALSQVVVPSVYFRDPATRIKPTIPGTDQLVRFHEAHLNHLIRRSKLKRQARRVALDAYLFGWGHFKIGYEVQVERNYQPILDPETGETLTDRNGNPLLEDGKSDAVYIEEAGRVRLLIEHEGQGAGPGRDYPQLNEYIEREYPYAIRWSPWDTFKDPLSLMPDDSDAEWVGFRTSMTVDEVRNHPYWENTSKVEPTQEPDFVRALRQRNMIDGLAETDRVHVHEIYHKVYDKRTNSHRVFLKVIADGANDFLFRDLSPLKVRGFPKVTLSFLDNPESPWPLAPIEAVRPQIDAINIANTQKANHRERFHHKYLYNKNAGISERDARRFARGGIGSVLGVKMEPNSDPKKAFQPADVPPIDQSLNVELDSYWRDIQRVDGTNEHHMGGAGIARQATQATFIESALGVRLNMKKDLLADALIEVMQKWTDLDRQYGDYERTYKITGIDGDTWQTYVLAEAIPEDFDLLIDMHSAGHDATMSERRDLTEFLNLTANLPEINRTAILKRLAQLYFFSNPDIVLQPQPQPAIDPATGQPVEGQPIGSLAETAIDTNRANQSLNPRANAANQ